VRKIFELTSEEIGQWKRLPSSFNQADGSAALKFWAQVADSRGLDPKSLLGTDRASKFSGLPKGHSKHWCYPVSLKCSKPPIKWEG
jgi:hypothetical protein